MTSQEARDAGGVAAGTDSATGLPIFYVDNAPITATTADISGNALGSIDLSQPAPVVADQPAPIVGNGISLIPNSLPPGPNGFPAIPNPLPLKAELDNAQTGLISVMGALADKIIAGIGAAQAPAIKAVEQIKAVVIGGADNVNEKAANMIGKAANKIRVNLDRKLADAYSKFAALGVPYPTVEQVLYGLQTGDYLGSVGLTTPDTAIPSSMGEANPPILEAQTYPEESTVVYGSPEEGCPSVTITNIIKNICGPKELPEAVKVGDGLLAVSAADSDAKKTEPEQLLCADENGVETPLDGGGLKAIGLELSAEMISTAIAVQKEIRKLQSDIVATSGPSKWEQLAGCIGITIPTKKEVVKEVIKGLLPVVGAIEATIPKTTGDKDVVKDTLDKSLATVLALSKALGQWCKDDPCDKAKEVINKAADLSKMWKFRDNKGSWEFPEWASPIFSGPHGTIKTVFFSTAVSLSHALDNTVQLLGNLRGCEGNEGYGIIGLQLIAGVLSRLTGGQMDSFFQGIKYTINSQCPTQIPSAEATNAAFLNGSITYEEWACWVKANNHCESPEFKLVEGDRSKPDLLMLLRLYRWGKLGKGRELFKRLMGQIGFIHDEDISRVEEATTALPPISDLIRYMVRDVADKDIVDKYNLMDGFDQKWTGELKAYGEAQGMIPEFAKYAWAAHWEFPSNTALFEMLHRLRDDSISANRINAQSLDKGGTGVLTTIEDIQQALEVNDLAPFWRERMSAISYRVMTRTDAIRAYNVGGLDEDELLSIFQDQGYTLETAQQLLKFTKLNKQRADDKRRGTKAINAIEKAYLNGLMTDDNLRANLADYITIRAEREGKIKELQTRRDLKIKEDKVKCIQRVFLTGGADESNTISALVAVLGPGDLAVDLVNRYWCSVKYKRKEPTAKMLCDWRERNLISHADHLTRLTRLGYTVEEATKIAADCQGDITERALAKVTKQLKEEERNRERVDKARTKAAKDAETASKKAAKAASGNPKDPRTDKSQVLGGTHAT